MMKLVYMYIFLFVNKNVIIVILFHILTKKIDNADLYIKEIDKGSFHIFEKHSKTVQGFFRPAVNIAPFDVTTAPAMPSRSFSIEDMKNSILIISGEENSVYTAGKAQDTEHFPPFLSF